MHCARSTGVTVAVLLAAAITGVPGAGVVQAADAAPPAIERVAHKDHQWYWHGGWWRHGPWSDHVIQGRVHTHPGVVFVPWGAERLRRCAATYRSYDPASGTYVSRGKRRVCR